ncbi:NAD(P)H-hydrate epimerase, partial [Francisella tularensis]|uniref:NAD(P)H-hydrate epimerase n=1 Tax=Francisella tularensis TaxID=263 RepID=UPI001F45FCE6
KQSKVLVIAGSGNNGSDGIAAAIKLFNKGYDVDIYRVFPKGNKMKKLTIAATFIISIISTSFAALAHQINSRNSTSFPTQ